MVKYSQLLPLLGQAVYESRRWGVAHMIVSRANWFGRSKLLASAEMKPGDVVLVDEVNGAGVSAEMIQGTIAAFGAAADEDQRAVLRMLRAVTHKPAGAAFEADEIAVGLWVLACALSRTDYADRYAERRAKMTADVLASVERR